MLFQEDTKIILYFIDAGTCIKSVTFSGLIMWSPSRQHERDIPKQLDQFIKEVLVSPLATPLIGLRLQQPRCPPIVAKVTK